ncbi:MAG: hypothetical protein LBR70_03890 [Lactobacillaceae bacterium]|jgi:hypothetical protein|nr:hypothetical protein [Lactobacillaceae bacterium]
MKKRRNYMYALIAVLAVFLVGVIFNIRSIREFYLAALAHATAIEVIVSAAIVGFVFLGNRYYWIIVVGCALVISIIIQLFLVGNGFITSLIMARACAFIGIVYIMNFVKLFINKK